MSKKYLYLGTAVLLAAGLAWMGRTLYRAKHNLVEPYVVYVGRRDVTKNTPLLLEYFARFKQAHGGDLRLVMIGTGLLPADVKKRADILDLGFVTDQTKMDALSGALCLCNPSVNESFSLQMMESWAARRPVLVHADCAVTVSHSRASHGGLWFKDYAEFEGALRWFLTHPAEATTMGEQGHAYVRQNFEWDRIVKKYVEII